MKYSIVQYTLAHDERKNDLKGWFNIQILADENTAVKRIEKGLFDNISDINKRQYSEFSIS